jgi:hypothetical protein
VASIVWGLTWLRGTAPIEIRKSTLTSLSTTLEARARCVNGRKALGPSVVGAAALLCAPRRPFARSALQDTLAAASGPVY